MLYSFDLGTMVPTIVGAAVVVVVAWRLSHGSSHPTQLVFALALGTALCGSSVFSSISWDGTKGEIKTVASSAREIAEIVKTNGDAITRLKTAVAQLRDRVALITTPHGNSDGPSGQELSFPSDSIWGYIKQSRFCEENHSKCQSITIRGNEVTMPKSTYDYIIQRSTSNQVNLDDITEIIETHQNTLEAIQRNLGSAASTKQ